MAYLGIDLGGTNIAAGLVSEDGTILARRSCPTPRGAENVADAITGHVRALLENGETAEYIGVGSPGSVDPENGVVKYWSNLDFYDVSLADMLRERTGLPALLENDANCAALGEYVAGAGRGSDSIVVITLGTGIGCGAVSDGRLYTGFNHAGLEVGHFVIEYNGRPCTCGRRGCFETYCSATALVRQATKAMEADPTSLLTEVSRPAGKVNGKNFFDAVERGDAAAIRVLREFTDYLGSGVTSLVNIFQPEVFCIGGGISAAGEALLGPVREVLDREDYARHGGQRTLLKRAELGNDAGIIGAALLANFRAE